MKLQANRVYRTPDGRQVVVKKHPCCNTTAPACTLVPYPDQGISLDLDNSVELRQTLSEFLYVEHGRIVRLDYETSPSPVPTLRDTGWSADDLTIESLHHGAERNDRKRHAGSFHASVRR